MECGYRADLQQLIDVFEYWHKKSTPFLRKSSSREEYLDEFLEAYDIPSKQPMSFCQVAYDIFARKNKVMKK